MVVKDTRCGPPWCASPFRNRRSVFPSFCSEVAFRCISLACEYEWVLGLWRGFVWIWVSICGSMGFELQSSHWWGHSGEEMTSCFTHKPRHYRWIGYNFCKDNSLVYAYSFMFPPYLSEPTGDWLMSRGLYRSSVDVLHPQDKGTVCLFLLIKCSKFPHISPVNLFLLLSLWFLILLC